MAAPVAGEPPAPVAPAPEAEPEITAPAGTPTLEEFDFENPDGDPDAAPATPAEGSPLDEVKELLAKEAGVTQAEADAIRAAFLRTERGRRMFASDQIRRELERSPEEGGLGRMPTLEEIRQGEADRLGMAEMVHDFEANPDNFRANFFGYRDAQGQVHFRPGAEAVLEGLPDHLAAVAPEIHSRLAAKAVAPYLQTLAQEIAALPQRTQDEAQAKLVWGRGLNAIEQKLLGRITRIPGFEYADGQSGSQPGAAPNPNDPLAAERAALDAQKAALQQQQAQAAQQRQQAAHQQILQTQDSTLAGDAQRILRAGGLDKIYPPVIFDQLVTKFISQVQSTIQGDSRTARSPLNPAGLKNYQIQLRQAIAGQLDPSLPVSQYRRMANEAMRRDAKAFLDQVSGNVTANSTAQHTAAAAAAGRREAPSGGGPQGAPAAQTPSRERPKGMDAGTYFEQRIANALTTPQTR